LLAICWTAKKNWLNGRSIASTYLRAWGTASVAPTPHLGHLHPWSVLTPHWKVLQRCCLC